MSHAIRNSEVIVSMSGEISEKKYSSYKLRRPTVAEIAAHGARDRCVGEGSFGQEAQVL